MRTRLPAALALAAALLAPASLPAQSSAPTSHWMFEDSPALGDLLPQPSQEVSQPQTNPTGQRVTVQGVVLNAATGQPLPRVLVKVEDTGALTDGEGRFEIPGVPAGLESFTAAKPGFRGPGSSFRGFDSSAYHLVHVAPNMPELSFSLAPTNTLSGHVTLSTGDPAVGIGIQLLKQSAEDGRANWTVTDVHQTNPEGEYRFAGLEDGTYLAMTQPAFDNDLTATSALAERAPPQLPGYPILFFADSADAAGASRIPLAGGQQGTANFNLALSPFHAVTIAVARPHAAGHWQFNPALQDRSGQRLNYSLLYDDKTSTIRTYLPDGSYTLTVEGNNLEGPERDDLPLSRQRNRPAQVAGLLDFSVSGHPEPKLRVVLASEVSTPIRVRYEPAPPARTPGSRNGSGLDGSDEPPPLGLWIKRSGGGDTQQNADWADADLFQLSAVAPGSYWVQASANRTGTCLGAVTAGGVSLGQTPLIIGPSGAGMPVEAVLRTDCASLALQLPSTAETNAAGEEPTYYVYAVPEFDSVAAVQPATLRPSAGGSATLTNLTPGSYLVLVFDAAHQLEYRNPSALATYGGRSQQVTLSPNATSSLLLELPKP
jgi:hypothetical protein